MHASLPLLLSAAATSVSAHMVMVQPKGWNEVLKDKSPLTGGRTASEPSNYPCKATGPSYYTDMPATSIAQGSEYTMMFDKDDTATHGGGSCQLSLTKDAKPTKDSDFRVIHSIEGGCPVRDMDGNLDGTGVKPSNYTFTMNPKVEPGKYTFAWTWFNNQGDREFYMNCAPIEVTAGDSSKQERDNVDWQEWDKLPHIMVANTNANEQCKSTGGSVQSGNIVFPDPGNSVEINPGLGAGHFSSNFIYPNNYCEAPDLKPIQLAPNLMSKASSFFTMNSNGPPAAPAPGADASTPATDTAATSSAAQPAQQTTQQAQQAAPQSPAPVASAVASTPDAAAPAPVGCLPTEKPCTAESGSIYCFNASSWGTCNNGCAVPMPVAGGMTCSGGAMKALSARAFGHAKKIHKHRRHWSFDEPVFAST